MTTIQIAFDAVSPSDSSPTARAWARGYARYCAEQLTAAHGGEEHEVKIAENSDYPDSDYRDLTNHIYDRWCGLSDGEQATYIA